MANEQRASQPASSLEHALARGALAYLEGNERQLKDCIRHFEEAGFPPQDVRDVVDRLAQARKITITMSPAYQFAPVLRVLEGVSAASYQETLLPETQEGESSGQER